MSDRDEIDRLRAKVARDWRIAMRAIIFAFVLATLNLAWATWKLFR